MLKINHSKALNPQNQLIKISFLLVNLDHGSQSQFFLAFTVRSHWSQVFKKLAKIASLSNIQMVLLRICRNFCPTFFLDLEHCAWVHKYKKYNNPTFFLKVDKPPKRISVPLAPPLCPFQPLTHGAYKKGEMPGSLLV